MACKPILDPFRRRSDSATILGLFGPLVLPDVTLGNYTLKPTATTPLSTSITGLPTHLNTTWTTSHLSDLAAYVGPPRPNSLVTGPPKDPFIIYRSSNVDSDISSNWRGDNDDAQDDRMTLSNEEIFHRRNRAQFRGRRAGRSVPKRTNLGNTKSEITRGKRSAAVWRVPPNSHNMSQLNGIDNMSQLNGTNNMSQLNGTNNVSQLNGGANVPQPTFPTNTTELIDVVTRQTVANLPEIFHNMTMEQSFISYFNISRNHFTIDNADILRDIVVETRDRYIADGFFNASTALGGGKYHLDLKDRQKLEEKIFVPLFAILDGAVKYNLDRKTFIELGIGLSRLCLLFDVEAVSGVNGILAMSGGMQVMQALIGNYTQYIPELRQFDDWASPIPKWLMITGGCMTAIVFMTIILTIQWACSSGHKRRRNARARLMEDIRNAQKVAEARVSTMQALVTAGILAENQTIPGASGLTFAQIKRLKANPNYKDPDDDKLSVDGSYSSDDDEVPPIDGSYPSDVLEYVGRSSDSDEYTDTNHYGYIRPDGYTDGYADGFPESPSCR